jgi:uncharacterized protein YfaS (alpha-2-macroglobulin family)
LIDVGPGGRDLKYTVPDYFNGKLRIVAIAVNAKRVGVSEADTEVKGDFILTPNVPAMVAPGDELIVSVGVFNNTVTKTANGTAAPPIQVEVQVSGQLSAIGPSRVDLQIADKQEGVAEFRFKTNPVLGAASLKFTARSGTSEARIEESTSVRPPIAFRTQLSLGPIRQQQCSRRADAIHVFRKENGRRFGIHDPAGMGSGPAGLSQRLPVLLHRTNRQQRHRRNADHIASGIRIN